MDGTIASQLQAIKSQLRGGIGDQHPTRRPLTRPSILFDPKEAADIDLRTILPIAISGLDVLASLDSRFEKYKHSLFSTTSLDLDREKMVPKEEKSTNKSIKSYLRLLSGHWNLPSSLKTLEYLIRRYQVHVYNVDELIMCALPYHDTHAFVKIVQLTDLRRNKIWGFLEGTKVSGAPPTRKVIAQQCTRDKGVLEAICNYASPTADFCHSSPVIFFCTAVMVEALGSIQKLDDEMVKRVLPFVFNGFNPSMLGCRDTKAGALMVVGLLASRATLSSKLTSNLLYSIIRLAKQDSNESSDLSWLYVTVMAIITIVQSQSLHVFPEKSLKILVETRDLSGILARLSRDFNIEKFLSLYLHTLTDYSSSDDAFCSTLISSLEIIPAKDFVGSIVVKVLESCLKLSQNTEVTHLHEAGGWAKRIMVVIDKFYRFELRAATENFFQNSKRHSMKEEKMLKSLCLMLDDRLDVPSTTPDSKFWFSLQHPKACVRQATLASLSSSGILKAESLDCKLRVIVQDTVIRQLHDDDLAIVQAALSIEELSRVINPPDFLSAIQDVLCRCIDIIKTGSSNSKTPLEVAVLCLSTAIRMVNSREVATMLFPLLIVHPKTLRVNLMALDLAKLTKWPFYSATFSSYIISPDESSNLLEHDHITTFNMKTIEVMSNIFSQNPERFIEWLSECGNDINSSKNLFLFIMLQAIFVNKQDVSNLLRLFQVCFPIIKDEWRDMASKGNVILSEESATKVMDYSIRGCLDKLFSFNLDSLNAEIIVCICWAFLESFTTSTPNNSEGEECKLLSMFDNLFFFFASTPLKDHFKEHILFLLTKCCTSPVKFLSKFFIDEGFAVDVQVESLLSFATVCSIVATSESSLLNTNRSVEFLVGFPSLLVPLSHIRKDIRTSAMNCIEALYKLWTCFDSTKTKNGSDTLLIRYVSTPLFGKLLGLIHEHRRLILSDVKCLPSLLTSMLGSVSDSLLVSQKVEMSFDQQMKDTILLFIFSSALKLPSCAKLTVLSLFERIGKSIIQISEVKLLLSELLEKRSKHCDGFPAKIINRLSEIEIETLCILLKSSVAVKHPANTDASCIDFLIKVLKVDCLSSEDPAVVKPCVVALQIVTSTMYSCLSSEKQDEIFANLVCLFRNHNSNIQLAAKEAILRIDVSYLSFVKLFERILSNIHEAGSSAKKKRKKSHIFFVESLIHSQNTPICFIKSLLDILFLKKDIQNRKSLMGPLFKLLKELFSSKIAQLFEEKIGAKSMKFQTSNNALVDAQQMTLIILENISNSLSSDISIRDDMFNKENVNLLIYCARSIENAVTHNHIFLLLGAIAKISSEYVSECMPDLLPVIGLSATKQNDRHSQRVLEDLISTLVPCWISKTDGIKDLLLAFTNVLPEIGECRRLALMVYLLRTLGEKVSLGIFLSLLFYSLASRKSKSLDFESCLGDLSSSASICKEWEFLFAEDICNQFKCNIWLPCLIVLIEEIGFYKEHEEHHYEKILVLHFVMQKLQCAELTFELESGQDISQLQCTLGAIMEKVVLQQHLGKNRHDIPSVLRKQHKEIELGLLKTITNVMLPSEYYKGITRLLGHEDVTVRKKALGFLCETVKNAKLVMGKHKQRHKQHNIKYFLHLDKKTSESFDEMCCKLTQLVDDSSHSVMLSAISSLEALANEVPSDGLIFVSTLKAVVRHITSNDLYISSSCLRCASALINVLGSKALPELRNIMESILVRAYGSYEATRKNDHKKKIDAHSSCKMPLSLSVLHTLEAIVEKLGCFLNPFLEKVIKLLVLHPEYISESDARIKTKAAVVRKLVIDRIPFRLTLPPLLKIYSDVLEGGDASLALAFEMLIAAIGVMDKSSVVSYYTKIFEQCLLALDLRHEHPKSIKIIDGVEKNVIHAIVTLTLRLTESMFRPLFLQSLEWAESDVVVNDSITCRSVNRNISFYNLVNKLAEEQRSLFVPYFKYLIDGSTRYLTDEHYNDSDSLAQKRKRVKIGGEFKSKKGPLSPEKWHLRALILNSLYKCFLYDTGNLKFLDTTNFQMLLKPIVSQLVAEPPIMEEQLSDIPTVEEVDVTLVCCLGQMAVAVGSDDIWKQLNHDVLMQTRSEKLRPRILGLKVVKFLMDHLKEEYLVLLPETIPFLGELLEDSEHIVKSLAQCVFKELESLSGENLRLYL